jgi:hypothetical protein
VKVLKIAHLIIIAARHKSVISISTISIYAAFVGAIIPMFLRGSQWLCLVEVDAPNWSIMLLKAVDQRTHPVIP